MPCDQPALYPVNVPLLPLMSGLSSLFYIYIRASSLNCQIPQTDTLSITPSHSTGTSKQRKAQTLLLLAVEEVDDGVDAVLRRPSLHQAVALGVVHLITARRGCVQDDCWSGGHCDTPGYAGVLYTADCRMPGVV